MIEIRTAHEGEPVYARLVDVIPEPERGGYLLIIEIQDGIRRKLWFPDPVQVNIAQAEAEADAARARANEAMAQQREAEARARAAQQALRQAEAKRRREVAALPEDEPSLDQ